MPVTVPHWYSLFHPDESLSQWNLPCSNRWAHSQIPDHHALILSCDDHVCYRTDKHNVVWRSQMLSGTKPALYLSSPHIHGLGRKPDFINTDHLIKLWIRGNNSIADCTGQSISIIWSERGNGILICATGWLMAGDDSGYSVLDARFITIGRKSVCWWDTCYSVWDFDLDWLIHLCNKLALIWCCIATFATEVSGCWQSSTRCCLNSVVKVLRGLAERCSSCIGALSITVFESINRCPLKFKWTLSGYICVRKSGIQRMLTMWLASR